MNKVISILLTVSLLISSSITVFAENTSISSDGEVNIPWNLDERRCFSCGNWRSAI